MTTYENVIIKYQEFFDMWEFSRAEFVNMQASKTFDTMRNYFIFNFGLLCLVQGQFHKSCRMFEVVILDSFEKYKSRDEVK